MIAVKNLTKIYGEGDAATPALQDVSFEIKQNEFVSIMGQSGSGKSTLLHMLGLLDHPTSGTYKLNGKDTKHLTDDEQAHLRNATIGFIFQSFHLLARTSVLDNVALPLQYSTTPRHKHEQLAREALQKVQLEHRSHHIPSELSGGEKQRAVIARALVVQPKLLLADEPTGNLDSKTGSIIMNLIDTLHHQGLTVIVITHETPTAEYAQRIIRLHDGRIESDRKVESSHRHDFRK